MKNSNLKTVANITTGKLDSNYAVNDGIYPFFTCAPEPLKINTYCYDCNAIMVAGNNAQGNFHINRYNGKFNAYQRTYVVTAKENYNIDFIYYNLKTALQQLKNKSQGSQTKFLTLKILENLPIENVYYKDQLRITNILGSLDKKIEINQKKIAELEETAKLIYDYWFVQFDFPDENGKPYKSSGGKMVYNDVLKREIPKNWEIGRLKGKIRFQRGISYTSKDIATNSGIPMINLACIGIDRNYRDGELKYTIGKIKENEMLNKNDLLIACTDLTRNADIIGSPILVPSDNQLYTFSADIAKVESISSDINNLYLYMTLRTEYYHDYIKYFASGTNVLHLDLNGINWYYTWFPPIELQNQFAEFISNNQKQQYKLIEENQQLDKLRDWILPMLMNGQVIIE